MDDQNQQQDSTPPAKFTNSDLKDVVGFGGYLKPDQITPERVQALGQEWHQSKIVKFGASFLLLVWIVVLGGISYAQFKLAGLAALAIVLICIVVSYRTYKKTKSRYAWYTFVVLVGAVAGVMFMLEHTK
jgi:TRAP-type C4-dicarboxylate transport system permease large subunit